MRWGMTVLLALVFCAATLILGGDSMLGRLSLAFTQPWLAAQFLDDPYWKGMALYRLGRFDESAAMFRTVGKPAFFNRGNALARAGHYEEAVAYYDAALFYHPEDQDARANRDLVNALIERNGDVPLNGNFIREDSKPQEDQETAKAKALRNDYSWADKIRYTSTFLSGQSVPATEEWLESLPDDPGRYLKLRIAAEHERRQKLGTAAPAADDPW